MNTKINSTTRRRFLKGLGVGAGGYALGSLLTLPKEAMGQSIESYLGKVAIQARWNVAARAYTSWMITCLQEMYDKRGREKFLDHFKTASRLAAVGSKQTADRLGLTGGNDPKSAAAIISAYLIVIYGPRSLQKYEIEEAASEKARLKCLDCAQWNDVQARKVTDDLCSHRCDWWTDGFVKELNPKLTSTLVKARPRGDSVCEWLIELKA
jgi:hypothetical protein